jgi:thiol-disulfide isomerase/thioredoxin
VFAAVFHSASFASPASLQLFSRSAGAAICRSLAPPISLTITLDECDLLSCNLSESFSDCAGESQAVVRKTVRSFHRLSPCPVLRRQHRAGAQMMAKRSKPVKALVILRSFLLILGLSIAPHANAIEVGKPAPPLEAKLLDGTQFSLAAMAGNVVIVNFWASWCEPCRAEMPALEAYYQKHRAEGLQLLAISMDESSDEPKVRELMRGFSFRAALARDASIKPYGRIRRIPLTFVIDRRGILRKDGWYGDAGIDLQLLESTVTPLLQAR